MTITKTSVTLRVAVWGFAVILAIAAIILSGCDGSSCGIPVDVPAAICLADGLIGAQHPDRPDKERCTKCDGRGTDGRVACDRCHGSGWITYVEPVYRADACCPVCGGSLICPKCSSPPPIVEQHPDRPDNTPGIAPVIPAQVEPADERPAISAWISYAELVRATRDRDGGYYVIVSAEWCPPCQALKARLRDNPSLIGSQTVGLCDFDANRDAARFFLRGRPLPAICRFRVAGGRVQTVEYWDGVQDLGEFFH